MNEIDQSKAVDDMERELRALGEAAPVEAAPVEAAPVEAAPAVPAEAAEVGSDDESGQLSFPIDSFDERLALQRLEGDVEMTEADVLLALVVQALDGEPVDVIAVVTALGYGDLVEAAMVLAEMEGIGSEVDDPALEDPDATSLTETEDSEADADAAQEAE
jgi:hypothetical protein